MILRTQRMVKGLRMLAAALMIGLTLGGAAAQAAKEVRELKPKSERETPAPTRKSNEALELRPKSERVTPEPVSVPFELLLFSDQQLDMSSIMPQPGWAYRKDEQGVVFFYDPAATSDDNMISIFAQPLWDESFVCIQEIWVSYSDAFEAGMIQVQSVTPITVGAGKYPGMRRECVMRFSGGDVLLTHVIWATETHLYTCTADYSVSSQAFQLQGLQNLLDSYQPYAEVNQ